VVEMAKRRKGQKTGGEVDILSFFPVKEEKKPEEAGETPVEREEKPQLREVVTRDVKSEVLEYISSKGMVPKSDMWAWAKSRGIKPAELYRALRDLEKEGLIRRVFDPEREELAYNVKA